jgi:hypothetical protein
MLTPSVDVFVRDDGTIRLRSSEPAQGYRKAPVKGEPAYDRNLTGEAAELFAAILPVDLGGSATEPDAILDAFAQGYVDLPTTGTANAHGRPRFVGTSLAAIAAAAAAKAAEADAKAAAKAAKAAAKAPNPTS